jgi:hypothetical protein
MKLFVTIALIFLTLLGAGLKSEARAQASVAPERWSMIVMAKEAHSGRDSDAVSIALLSVGPFSSKKACEKASQDTNRTLGFSSTDTLCVNLD